MMGMILPGKREGEGRSGGGYSTDKGLGVGSMSTQVWLEEDGGRGGVDVRLERWAGLRSEGPFNLSKKFGLSTVGHGPMEGFEQ